MKRMVLTLLCAASIVLSLGLVACGSGVGGASSSVESTSSTQKTTDSVQESEPDSDKEKAAVQKYTDVSDVDFESIDEAITYGDYDAMSKLVEKVKNQNYVNKVVQIEGMMGTYESKPLILEPNEAGDEGVGLPLEVPELSGYPHTGARVHLVGVTRKDADGEGVIVAPSEYFAQVEEGDKFIKLTDASLVVPKGWQVVEDKSPTELSIKRGAVEIEFWCAEKKANDELKNSSDLWEWKMFGRTFEGYSKNNTEHKMVCNSLVISGSDIYLSDLKEFLEKNLVM